MLNISDVSFTNPALHAFVLAKEHALRLGHEQFGAEHIFLGILDSPRGGAKQALDSRLPDRSLVRARLDEIIPAGSAPPERGELPYSVSGMNVVRNTIDHARSTGTTVVTTGHVLLGLLSSPNDPPYRALNLAGVNILELEAAARDHLDDGAH